MQVQGCWTGRTHKAAALVQAVNHLKVTRKKEQKDRKY